MTKVMPKDNDKVDVTLKNGMTLSGVYVNGHYVVGPFRVQPRDVKAFRIVK